MKPHILVVDDSLTVRMDLRGALTAAGFEVTVCDTKRTADTLLKQRQFSAAILDVMLPDGDGVTILREIRSNEAIATLPVILLSSEAEVRDRVRGLTMGADEYVGKPYDIAYLIRCVRTLCRRERASIVPPAPFVGGRRILAVDDSPTFLAHLARILREDGHDVVLARSGHEALDMLAAQTIDCVVLDLQMPDIDGIETLRRIRQTPGRESTPTLILTASEDPEAQRDATAAGVDDFLRKTVTFDQVRAKIRNLLRRKHADRPATEAQSSSRWSSVKPNLRKELLNDRQVSNSKPPSRPFPAPSVPPAPARKAQDHMINFSPLFLEVAAAMGLSADLARDALVRALRRMDIDPKAMNHADLSRALPMIHDTLSMFFPAEEAGQRARTVAALASRADRPSMA